MKSFDGKKLRDQILAELSAKIMVMPIKPKLAAILIGHDPISLNYVQLKEKIAGKIGVVFELVAYSDETDEEEILSKIDDLNLDPKVGGIMIQIPLPSGFDRDRLIKSILPAKDIDGLRYCLGAESKFVPPVVLAIGAAIDDWGGSLKEVEAVLVGKGFLVGGPLERYLKDKINKLQVLSGKTEDLKQHTVKADLIISATGHPRLICSGMVKDEVVLIDAGTGESGGKLSGDIDFKTYEKASFYTPVPGGIGPVTIAMLMKNLVAGSK